jgi:hypothetical protein
VMHVHPAAGVGDVQGGLSDVTVDFGKMCHLGGWKETLLNISPPLSQRRRESPRELAGITGMNHHARLIRFHVCAISC